MSDQRKSSLDAVFDEELEELLERLGLIGDFRTGNLKCAFCGDVITWENLHSIFPDSGQIKVSCSKSECVEQLALRLQELEGRE
jgi:hypothetical protein